MGSLVLLGWVGAVGAAEAGEDKGVEKPWYGNFESCSVGPAIGGRVARASGVLGDPLTWCVATAQGGVWRPTDGGVEFSPLFDE